MSTTHPTAIRNAIADFVLDQLNEGTPPGYFEFLTAADAVVATLTFSNPAFLPAVAGVGEADEIDPDPSAVGGTIAKAIFYNAAGGEKFRCSVTATGGGGDIELSSVVVTASQAVSLTALTYEAPL